VSGKDFHGNTEKTETRKKAKEERQQHFKKMKRFYTPGIPFPAAFNSIYL